MEGSAATSVEVVLSGPQARKDAAVAAQATRIVPLGLCLIEYQTIDGPKWLDQGAPVAFRYHRRGQAAEPR